jgi:hypothetical protein
MDREQNTEVLTVTVSRSEKDLLVGLAYERGATLSGLIRKMIRDAAGAARPTSEKDLPQSDDERSAVHETIGS